MKKQGLKCLLKKEIICTLLKRDFKRLSGLYTMAGLHDLSPICAKLDFGILEKNFGFSIELTSRGFILCII